MTETLRNICRTAHDETINEMSVDEESPKDNDRVKTDYGPGRALLITSPDKTCMVYDSDIQTFTANTQAESGAPNYLANRECALMLAQGKGPMRTIWITTAQACVIMTCDYSKSDQITNIILDLSLPAFRQSAEDKREFQMTEFCLRIACFANDAMCKINTTGDPNLYPEPSSSHTSLVYINVLKEPNSELVYLHKFLLDPLESRINQNADQSL